MILGNLVSNAAKYSPAETPVRIYCDRVGGHTRFRIEDEGPGVPDFLRLRVFRAGERGVFGGDSGCGLGLFIASRLCDAIGAEIQIENNDNRRGACFAVTLMG
jgi:two-component system sensor histidine kinase KdpD